MAAPNLPTLIPTSFSSQTGTTWTTTTVGNVDNTVAAPDGAFIVAGANATGSIFYAFTDTPADFIKILTLNYNIRYKIDSLAGDTEVLFFRVWDSAKTTAYTNEATVNTLTASLAITNKGSTALTITSAGLAASKADWDAAFIEIRTTHTANMGNDGSIWSIDEFELTGTYDAAPTVALSSPSNGGTTSDSTPDLDFVGTDPNGNDIEFQVQIDTANTFDSSTGFDLKYVDLRLVRVGAPPDNLTLEIRSTSISGTTLGTSNAVVGSTISDSGFATIRFTFATPITLSPSTKYYMVLKRDGVRDTFNSYQIGIYDQSTYPSNGLYSNSSGVWSAESAGNDFTFYIYDIGTNLRVSQPLQAGPTGPGLNGGTGNGQEYGQSFTTDANVPLINVFSDTASGFTDVTNGADTHPFTSGNTCRYTVQSTLSDGTYYWHVRAIDPTGSNTYGAYATTRSFTVSTGTLSPGLLMMFN